MFFLPGSVCRLIRALGGKQNGGRFEHVESSALRVQVRLKSDSQLYAVGTTSPNHLLNHRGHEMFEGGRGIAAAAGVDGGGLDYSAARGDEPMETLALRKLADRSGAIATATNRWN